LLGGIEFVKQYQSHVAPLTHIAVSVDGTLAASIAKDKQLKIYDVCNYGRYTDIKHTVNRV
jgi:peptidylprolyl isomerase domain and WD repeat-containing protein 1